MVAVATSHSLLRFDCIALMPTVPALLQNKISFSNKKDIFKDIESNLGLFAGF